MHQLVFPKEQTVVSSFQTLPVIDITGLYSDSAADRKAVALEIGKAARDSGFFYVRGHHIGADLRASLLAETKAFFALTLDEKMKCYIGQSSNHSGYVPQGEEAFYGQKPDRKEAFDLSIDIPADDPVVLAGTTPMVGPVQWPQSLSFKAAVSQYYTEITALSERLFGGFALALDLPEDWFKSYLQRPPSQLRLIHYPYVENAPADEPGIGAHTDYECFTILLPTAPGLEVMNGNGVWIDAPPIEDTFVINIGDMLEAWTNGTFVATSHRVRKIKEERYSFPFFATCDYHTVVAPLPQFVNDDRPAKFAPLVSGDHLVAQTAMTFAYLRKRMELGTFKLPDSSLALSSFGQEARNRKTG
jgi:isopenicillin N synthase-like dioxygenase